MEKAEDMVSNVLSNELLESEETFAKQQYLYGEINPSPMKHEIHEDIPKLNTKLTFPKQRKRSNTMEAKYYKISDKENLGVRKSMKRPSTCGKEGIRHFSTPLPLRVSLQDTNIPQLSPNTNITNKLTDLSRNDDDDSTEIDESNLSINSTDSNSSINLSFMTPNSINFTSPLSVRSFSTPLADIREKNKLKMSVQLKLNQLSKDECNNESKRQIQREILKLRTEVEVMKKVKKYRDSKESEKMDQLIEKWRNIAQMASNYMLNEARYKVERMGGLSEFRNKQKKAKLRKMKFEFDESLLYRIEEYMESEEYKNLDKYEKEEIISRKNELEKMSEMIENGRYPGANDDDDNNDNDGDDDKETDEEFTMEDLYKQLKLDYDLVYKSK